MVNEIVFNYIQQINLSALGELGITDMNKLCIWSS